MTPLPEKVSPLQKKDGSAPINMGNEDQGLLNQNKQIEQGLMALNASLNKMLQDDANDAISEQLRQENYKRLRQEGGGL